MRLFGRKGGDDEQLPGRQISAAFWRSDAPPADPLAAWIKHARAFGETGRWPVLIEDSPYGEWELIVEDGWQAKAARDGDDVLAELWAEYARLGPFPGVGEGRPERDEAAARMVPEVMNDIAALGLVECERPADVPSAIGWTGAVNVHDSAVLTSILRAWEDRYDARLVGLGFDTMYLAVHRLPLDRDRAAAELYMFCPDIVEQGADSVEALAEGLDQPVWPFWWD
jgi:hypothetical protein